MGAEGAVNGNEVILGSDKSDSKDTFMHEMVHVVQQRSKAITPTFEEEGHKINDEDKNEREAENWQNFKAGTDTKSSIGGNRVQGVY